MSHPRLTLALVLGLGACAVSAQQAPAKQAPPAKDDLAELEDLLNTPIQGASKREQRLIDSPQAIEVLTGDEIRQMGIYKLSDALKMMTSVDVLELDNAATNVTLRGAMQQGQPRTVQILVDNVPLYNAEIAAVDIDNLPVTTDLIDKIEVVRGPSSSLYGANAVVGVIAITTRRSKGGFKGGARATALDWNSYRGAADVQISAGPVSVIGGYQGSSLGATGQRTYAFSNLAPITLNENASHQDTAFARMDIGFGQTSLWAGGGLATKMFGSYTGDNFPYQKAKTQTITLGWGQTWFEGFRTEVRASNLNQQFIFGPNPGLVVPFNDPAIANEYPWVDFDSTLFEVQVNWDLSKNLHLVGGLDTRKYSAAQATFVGFLEKQEESASGGFINADWSPAPTLTLSAGVRAENESLGGSRTSPRVAGVWNPTNASSLRLGWYSSSRSPQVLESRVDFTNTFTPPPPFTTGIIRIIPNPSLEPEKVTSLELGYRHILGQVSFDVTLFQMTFNKLIAQVPLNPIPDIPNLTLTLPYQYQNTGDAKDKGLELAVTWRPTAKASIGANGTWLDYKLEATDTRPSYAPARKGNVWVRWTEGIFSGYVSFQHVSEVQMESLPAAGPLPPNRPRSPINQVNANLSFQLGRGATLAFFTKNALKEDFTDQGSGTPGRTTYVLSARRESGVTLGYRF